MRALVRGEVVAIELWSPAGRRLARAGSDEAVARKRSELVTRGGSSSAILTVSVTDAATLAHRIRDLTGFEVAVFRARRALASTVGGAARLDLPGPDRPADLAIDGREYRGRTAQVDEAPGAPVELAVLRPAAPFSEDITANRVLIADAPARYGGEEMAIVLPQTDAEGAAVLAERIREAVEDLQVPRVGGGGTIGVTASFGVAALPEAALERSGLIAAADAALYRAKHAGKNRVERAGAVPEPSSPPR